MGNHPLLHPLLYCALPRRLPLLLPGKFETVKDLNPSYEESELGIFHYHHIINNSHPAELRCHEDGGALRTSQGSRVMERGKKNLANIHPFFLSQFSLHLSKFTRSKQQRPDQEWCPMFRTTPPTCANVSYCAISTSAAEFQA